MNSAALVISDDLILRSQTRTLLSELHVACTCSGILGFKRILESAKFDAIVLGVGNSSDTKSAIEQVRTGKLNRYSIVLALVDDGPDGSAGWSAGANFTIRRSSCFAEDLKKAFESAHGLILREKRRYHRHPIDIDIILMCNGRTMTARMVDISERGACLECPLPISSQQVQLEFCLPGLKQAVKIDGVPAWCRAGRVGIQFTAIAENSRVALSEWLTIRMSSESPQK
jgi:hypothetical protein